MPDLSRLRRECSAIRTGCAYGAADRADSQAGCTSAQCFDLQTGASGSSCQAEAEAETETGQESERDSVKAPGRGLRCCDAGPAADG